MSQTLPNPDIWVVSAGAWIKYGCFSILIVACSFNPQLAWNVLYGAFKKHVSQPFNVYMTLVLFFFILSFLKLRSNDSSNAPLAMVDSDHQLSGSLNQNSRYSRKSFAPSTHSWTHESRIPPPQPINLPSPVQALRPLPNPHARHDSRTTHKRGPLHVVNTPGSSNFTDEQPYTTYETGLYQSPPTSFDPSFGALRPRKKKSFVGGFVKGIRRLPKSVFGYGNGLGLSERTKVKHDDSEGMETTSPCVTAMSTGNTLPVYTSNPPTPVLAGPVHPGPSSHYRPQVAPIPESPLPAVVRLDDQKGYNPTFRVSPPQVSPDHGANDFAPDVNHVEDHSNEILYSNPVDRTTVMVYNERETLYDRHSRAPDPPPPVVSRELSSPGLSYVSSEHPGSVRPLSFHSNHPRAPTPIETSQPGPASLTEPRVSYASQGPTPRATPSALIPGAVHSSSSSIHAHTPSEAPQPATTAALPASEEPAPNAIQSPISVHPTPGADYLKMTLSSPPTSHGTITTGTSYYDPSFSSALNPVEKFFKTLYNMPWISHDRVTVDYHPGDGLGVMKKRKFRPATSWYQSMLSRSRRSSASLDLLSSGGTSPSTGNSLGMRFGSPIPEFRRGRSDKSRNKSHHHSSSHRHRYHHTSSNKHQQRRKRRTATTMDSTNTESKQPDMKPVIAPFPPVYPFHYPYTPYTYPNFPTFPMSAYTSHTVQKTTQPAAQSQTRLGDATNQQQPALAMYAPAGYPLNSYQPMIGPQVYVLSSPTTKAEPSILPTASITRSSGPGQRDGNEQQANVNQSGSLPTGHSGMLYMQTIPGAFS